MAVEEPAYTVSLKDGDCELRAYPPMIAAEVTVSGAREQAINEGFRLLAGYIFGGNVRKQKIAMTAPVVQAPQSEKIAMTAPVLQQASGTDWLVRFIMPAKSTLETLPTPNDPKVRLVALPAARFAVVRFTGLTQAGDLARETKVLDAFVASHDLHPTGATSLARYDPPWTLWFMRRNELMVPVG